MRGKRNIILGRGLIPIPERLLLAHSRGEVLFIAGAGISQESGLPSFKGLVQDVYKTLDPGVYSELTKSSTSTRTTSSSRIHRLTPKQSAEIGRFKNEHYDTVLGMLERRLAVPGRAIRESPVRRAIRNRLNQARVTPSPIHRSLVRLSDRGATTTIITTNFDRLLEDSAKRAKLRIQSYALGEIPRPTSSRNYSPLGWCRGVSWCRAIVLFERGDSVAGERDLNGDQRIVAVRFHGLQVAGDAGIGLAVG